MHIGEMHVMFRQFAQQMGMQNIRAILPEQIDLLLNTSIMDITNQLIRSTVGVSNDRIITDNSKIQQINALQPLYKVQDIPLLVSLYHQDTEENLGWCNFGSYYGFIVNDKYYVYKAADTTVRATIQNYLTSMFKTESCKIELVNFEKDDSNDHQIDFTFTITNNESIDKIWVGGLHGATEEACLTELKTKTPKVIGVSPDTSLPFIFKAKHAYSGKLTSSNNYNFPDYLYLVDFSINYKIVKKGFDSNGINYDVDENSFESNQFPVRLIDYAYLADTLNDFMLKPCLRSPIIVTLNNGYELYFGKFNKQIDGSYTLENKLLPYIFRFAYIAKPDTVRYDEDLSGHNTDCNLPPYLHEDIVKHAVELYMQALGRGPRPQESDAQQANTGESTTPQARQ